MVEDFVHQQYDLCVADVVIYNINQKVVLADDLSHVASTASVQNDPKLALTGETYLPRALVASPSTSAGSWVWSASLSPLPVS